MRVPVEDRFSVQEDGWGGGQDSLSVLVEQSGANTVHDPVRRNPGSRAIQAGGTGGGHRAPAHGPQPDHVNLYYP